MTEIIIPVAAMTLLGLLFGAGLALALKIFGIEVDPKMALIITKLPGANCGACGKAGCAGFAAAVFHGEVPPSACPVSSDETRQEIASILGLDQGSAGERMTAVVKCNGGEAAKDKYTYRGIKSCKAASLVFGGYKACSFGCLGFGDCADVCPFGAISVHKGLAVINHKKCTGCGNCVKACPKGLIELIPAKAGYYVKCNSKDPAPVKVKACKASCIACRKCEKACSVTAIKVDANLSRIDYQKCQNIGKCAEVCPTKVIVKI
ncbi:MAG: RnfABCDGE type electron transport complex subunit B [Candidatus Omnitrophica bacterium]|nr:RnfABCDGE type electron transport complex subunit B [Candidatus Omnitrophota bacterium]MDD4013892.1 RnfABCDGE type electron transport complex subunit B [Candidatus Omnitrophota bacterium]